MMEAIDRLGVDSGRGTLEGTPSLNGVPLAVIQKMNPDFISPVKLRTTGRVVRSQVIRDLIYTGLWRWHREGDKRILTAPDCPPRMERSAERLIDGHIVNVDDCGLIMVGS